MALPPVVLEGLAMRTDIQVGPYRFLGVAQPIVGPDDLFVGIDTLVGPNRLTAGAGVWLKPQTPLSSSPKGNGPWRLRFRDS